MLVLKLGLTPILIAAASLAARRWGPSIGGWIVALPLTSGPVLFFLAVDHGTPFAATAAVGSLAGLAAIAVFSLAYAVAGGHVAGRRGPITGLIAGTAAFGLVGAALQPIVETSVWLVAAAVVIAIFGALRLLPTGQRLRTEVAHPWWDLPARMVVATSLVLGLTSVAPLLGPRVSGLVATFPVYLSVLTAFAHRQAGIGAAVGVLRGLLTGMLAAAAFFLVVDFTLEPAGIGPAFAAALVSALTVQAVALGVLRRPSRSAEAAKRALPLPEL
ncbi:MAG: hypothetical protein ACRDQC_05330 [Gaiellales bacterium]